MKLEDSTNVKGTCVLSSAPFVNAEFIFHLRGNLRPFNLPYTSASISSDIDLLLLLFLCQVVVLAVFYAVPAVLVAALI